MLLFYNFFLATYGLGVRIAATRNPKAAMWVDGRKGWRSKMATALPEAEWRIWIHCSSLGEFEQGRPLIDLLRQRYPAYKVVLTFFSPSGYEVCKGQGMADYVFYLPMDGAANARDFIKIVQPKLVIFVKYEFWYHYLHQVHRQGIPLLLVSAAFRMQQPFFAAWGSFFRRMLGFYSHLHVQDSTSATLLRSIGITNVTVSGDTRYDRVNAIAARLREIPEANTFKGQSKILIAGSTWPADEEMLSTILPILPADWKLIIAPHEIDTAHIQSIRQLFPDTVCYSQLGETTGEQARVLIVDNIGLLSSLYAWGDVAWVGGGFARSGIHNTLEPAIFGLPIVMGPIYQKFVEAVALVAAGCAFPVIDEQQAARVLKELTQDDQHRNALAAKMKEFIANHTGAANRICSQIADAGWLK